MVHTIPQEGTGRYATVNTASRNTQNCYKTTEDDQKYLSIAIGSITVNNLGRSKNLEGPKYTMQNKFTNCFVWVRQFTSDLIFEPRSEKTGLRGFRPGPIQTGLYSYRRWLEA